MNPIKIEKHGITLHVDCSPDWNYLHTGTEVLRFKTVTEAVDAAKNHIEQMFENITNGSRKN
jgi:hypothetical protein